MANILKFKVSSGIKDIVGKDLITDDFIAVFELVKNSFDAHATDVVISFNDNKLTISDNGKGMTLDELKSKWLFLAFSAKKDRTEDNNINQSHFASYRDKIQVKRHYAGSKGIGRFSADRLGQKLRLITKSVDSDTIEQISINWEEFKDQNKEFGTVAIDHHTLDNCTTKFPQDTDHGLILEIEDIKHWPREKLIELKHSLEKLINPFSETNDFNISIECSRELKEDHNGSYKRGPNKGKKYAERDRVNGKVKNAILEILELKTTQINVEIDKSQITTRIFDRGTLIYHITESNNDFTLLEEANIDLYFLNTAAKYNFTKKMGVQPVNFGSVFLFKNGFRVQPFGNPGNDSWGLDYRAQQGHSRFLGTRDLFGRVEITTENTDEFKEVSSRDGGLVETFGYHQLMNAFKNKALIRLERYVVGVLWGEGFKKRKYFGIGDDAIQKAESYRKELQEKDKNADNISFATSNLGSKIDFIQLIKGLSSNKEIQIIDFNKEFVDLVNERLDEIDSKYILDLEIIAEKTNDPELKDRVMEADKRYKQLLAEKEEAERRAVEEERRRIEAEQRVQKEEEARKQAEQRQKKAEEQKRIAELEAVKRENEKIIAELAKIKAEQKAKEEEKKREKEEEARRKAENEVSIRKQQIARYNAAESIEYKDLRDSNHIIGVYSDDISKKILLLKRQVDKGKQFSKKELLNFIQGISLANEKISTITRFTTKSNYLKAALETEEDIVSYIGDYIKNIYLALYKSNIEIITNEIVFVKKFQPIELITAIDNILSNSRKKLAKKVIFDFKLVKDDLQLSIRDIGDQLCDSIQDSNLIFEEGVTTTKGSGLGLNHVKRIVEESLNGKITYNSEYKSGFELLITIPK